VKTYNTLATSDTNLQHHTRLQNVNSYPFYTITPKILSGWVNIYTFLSPPCSVLLLLLLAFSMQQLAGKTN
jgi:hypothetical protein